MNPCGLTLLNDTFISYRNTIQRLIDVLVGIVGIVGIPHWKSSKKKQTYPSCRFP